MALGIRSHARVVFGALMTAALAGGWPAPAAAQTARVSGTVVDATTNAPLAGGTVNLCRSGTSCVQVTTSPTGAYVAVVPSGSYDLYTTGFEGQGYVNAWHTGQVCPGPCGASHRPRRAERVDITVAGRFQSFALIRAGRIGGRVTNAASRAPVASVLVEVRTEFNELPVAVSGRSDATGTFDLPGLPPGAYGVAARPREHGYPDQTFGGTICLNECSPPRVVGVEAGTMATADFALTPGALITGVVRSAATNALLGDIRITAVLDSGGSGQWAGLAFTNAQGVYRLGALPAGKYRLLASTAGGDGIQVFGGVACATPKMCTVSNIAGLGTPIEVTAGSVTAERNFLLPNVTGFGGTVAEAGSGVAVTSGLVRAYRIVNGATVFMKGAAVDGQGRFSVLGLPPGEYAASFSDATHPEVTHAGRVCTAMLECRDDELLAGAPIQVRDAAAAIVNIPAVRGGSLRVAVTDASGAALADAAVFVVARAAVPEVIDRLGTDAAGQVTFTALPPGSYAVFASGRGAFTRVAGGPVCQSQPKCTPEEAAAGGQAVDVASNSLTSVSVSLPAASGPPFTPGRLLVAQEPRAVFIEQPVSESGPAATGWVLEAATTPSVPSMSLPIPPAGLRFADVPAGTYFVRARALNQAGSSAPGPWARLDVTYAPEPPSAVVAWMSGTRLVMSWDTSRAQPGADYVIEVGSAAGRSDVTQIPVDGASFTYAPVPPGVYFVRVRSRDARGISVPAGETMLVVGDVPAPPRPPVGFEARTHGRTAFFHWEPPPGGADDYVLEAGTDYGRSDIGAFAVGSGTSFTVPNVPDGEYYVRLRGRNARGMGLPDEGAWLSVPRSLPSLLLSRERTAGRHGAPPLLPDDAPATATARSARDRQ